MSSSTGRSTNATSAERETEPQAAPARAGGSPPAGRVGAGLGDAKPDDLPIEDLNLSMRGYNTLRRAGLPTVGAILGRREDELLSVQNFGRKCYEELRDKFDELGILSRDAAWSS